MTAPSGPQVSISPLLKRLADPLQAPSNPPSPSEISAAFSLVFSNSISPTQLASFLTLLHRNGLDKDPSVIAACAQCMRDAASPIDAPKLLQVLGKRKRKCGSYGGGLCDIVGTGGDSHSTFNISTTSSIIASPLLAMAKHGNRAQTSMSGSADVLNAIQSKAPNLAALTAEKLPDLYAESNYAFLFAPNFHPGMKYAATVRRELGIRTIFNVMGPLANPVDSVLEARLVGVAYQGLGPVFAEALRLSGSTKALVVCGEEDLDEISCAGATNCWMLKAEETPQVQTAAVANGETPASRTSSRSSTSSTTIDAFQLHPSDFGLPAHPLSEVGGGKLPHENAATLMQILRNELAPDHPILHFVLMNVAALLVVSGVCDSDSDDGAGAAQVAVIKERGPGGGRWKEGVRRARWCIESGRALQELQKFIDFTNKI